MIPLKEVFSSTVGKKLIAALTGLALFLFVITHLLGNLQLLLPSGDSMNEYAHVLASFGWMLWAAEIGLLAMFLIHGVTGLMMKRKNLVARGPVNYKVYKTKKGPSKQNASTRSMAITGSVLLIFTILHVIHFKFGPSEPEGYVTTVNGQEIRDLYRLVIEQFKNPLIVALYTGVMILLGLHLRHGVWSAFQSLGLLNRRLSPVVYTVGAVIGVLLAVGFLLIPLWIYIDPMGVYL